MSPDGRELAAVHRTTIQAYTLRLRGIELSSHIGVSAEERSTRQELLVDVDLELAVESLPGRDVLDGVVDYDAVACQVVEEGTARPYRLLETLVARMVDRLLCDPSVARVRVAVTKSRVPTTHPVASAVVELVGSRSAPPSFSSNRTRRFPMNENVAVLEAMRASVRRFDLLEHPFYRAWSAGTLAVESLATYAREYGAFVSTLDQGWTTLDEPRGAAVERHHAELWGEFAEALGTAVTAAPALSAVQALVHEATRSFSTPASALGALYAFEVQQPATAQSKLDGLDTRYASLPRGVRPYFQAHACETGEDALLESKLAAMSDGERENAALACERMAKALWDALTGIHAIERMA